MAQTHKEEEVLSYSVKVYRKPNGSNCAFVEYSPTDMVNKIDLSIFNLELDKMKQEIVDLFIPDIETEEFTDAKGGLFDGR